MRFSFWPSASLDWSTLLAQTLAGEAAGWDGMWLADHFMPNTDSGTGEVQECLSLLAGLAATVPRIRLGSLVLGNTYRHPAVVANQARTIDEISGGRFVLGMGAGWQKNEHAKFGIDLPPAPELLRRFGEALQVLRGLRDDERATFTGEFYTITDAPMSEGSGVARPIRSVVRGESDAGSSRGDVMVGERVERVGRPGSVRPQEQADHRGLREDRPRSGDGGPLDAGRGVPRAERCGGGGRAERVVAGNRWHRRAAHRHRRRHRQAVRSS